MRRSLHLVSNPITNLVLDTSVLVSALRSPTGTSAQLFLLCLAGEYTAVVTPALLFEFEAVLHRPEHAIPTNIASAAIAEMAAAFSHTRINFSWRPQLRDADDELVLEAAINGNANTIVTHNVRDFLPESSRFGIQILTPGDIIGSRRSR